MPMVDIKCKKCGHVEEYYEGPNYKDEPPVKCPVCKSKMLERQFPNISKVGVDVIGGYEYQYGKKNWGRGKTDLEKASYLVKGDDGKYKDPY